MHELIKHLKEAENHVTNLLGEMLHRVHARDCEPVCWVLDHETFSLVRKFDQFGRLFGFGRSGEPTMMDYPVRLVSTARVLPYPMDAKLDTLCIQHDPALLAIEYRNRFALTGYIFHKVTAEEVKESL